MLERIAGNRELKQDLKTALGSGRIAHSILLVGEPGCGAGFAARCLAADYLYPNGGPHAEAVLREEYPDVTPAWHSSKKHWNDIRTTGDLPDAFIRAQIRNSYLLVLRQNVTPKSLREEILAYVGEHGLPE